MTRLIDAYAFKKENERLLHCDFPYLSEATLEELIDEAPTVDAVPVIWCSECYFWDKEPSQTAMPEVHTCRYWRIGTTCVDYCARASEDGWLKAMPKENANEAD